MHAHKARLLSFFKRFVHPLQFYMGIFRRGKGGRVCFNTWIQRGTARVKCLPAVTFTWGSLQW